MNFEQWVGVIIALSGIGAVLLFFVVGGDGHDH
jgi:hypothetical protein